MINNNLLIIDESFLSAELFFCIGLAYLTFESNRLSLVTIFKKNNLSIFETLIQLATNVIITLLVIYGALMLYFIGFLSYTSLSGFSTEVKSFSIFFSITSLLYNMLAISYKLLNKRNEELFNDEETLKEQIQYELENYQAEVNPDLLFESLESTVTLIHQDIDLAEDYIDHLALVYRYMLQNKDNESIPLKREIEAGNNLVYLHNVRNKGLIKFVSEIDGENINTLPGSIPFLIEEIIKGNIISEVRPMNIVLAMEDNYITLSHKLNKRLIKNQQEVRTFKRLQSAYSYYTDQPLIKIEAYGEAFYKIPILDLKTAVA